MFADSDDDSSPAITFSRSVKPAARRMARVLQEDDSPNPAQQAFKTPQRDLQLLNPLQQAAQLTHCAGTCYAELAAYTTAAATYTNTPYQHVCTFACRWLSATTCSCCDRLPYVASANTLRAARFMRG